MEAEPRLYRSDLPPPEEGGRVALFLNAALEAKTVDLSALWTQYRNTPPEAVRAAVRSFTEGVTRPTTPAEVDGVVQRFAWLATAYQLDALMREEDPEIDVHLPAWDATPNLCLAWLAFLSIDSPQLGDVPTRVKWLESFQTAAQTLMSTHEHRAWEQRPLSRLLLSIRERTLKLLPDEPNGTGMVSDPVLVAALVEEATDLMDQTVIDTTLSDLESSGCVDRLALVTAFRALSARVLECRRTNGPHIPLYARYIRFRHYLHGPHAAQLSVHAIEPELSHKHAEYFHGLLDGEYTKPRDGR